MRLIDLDTLKQNLCGDCTINFPKECRQIGCTKVDKQDILEALRIPIIDAVPVIRCKDCKHWYKAQNEDEYSACAIWFDSWGDCMKDTNENGYCHMAERRDHE